MIYIHSKRFVSRIFAISLVLLFGMHYTWLCYYYVSTNSHEGHLAVLELHSNHTSRKNHNINSTTNEAKGLNSSMTRFPRCKTPVFLLIVVFSSPNNFEQRSIIRSTWAEIKDTDPNVTNIINVGSLVKTVFLLGQTNEITQRIIQTESEYFKDVVIGSFIDTYGNLTSKAKLGLEWAYQFCNFQYYLKTDDDVFVYSKGLVKWLWQLPRERVYTGRCDFNKSVIRTVGHKWGVSKTDYKRETYPPYCVGMGYIFSSDVLQNLMLIVPTQPLFLLEDVYVGLMLEKLKIVPVDKRKYFQVHYDYSWDVCKNRNMLLSLEVNPKQMLELHMKFSTLWKCAGP